MKLLITYMFICPIAFFFTGPTSQAQPIAPRLQSTLAPLSSDEEVPVIITFSDKVDLKLFKDKNKGILRANLIRTLKSKANSTQGRVKAFLASRGAKRILTLWIINGMAVTVRTDVIRELANWPEIEGIRLDSTLKGPKVIPAAPSEPEWNISAIGAPEIWDLGYTGEGIVVAGMDTGVDLNHPDLRHRWRGGTNSWFDPNGEHDTPFDKDGHGTHTMGIMVGGTAGGTAIGVAPGASWIAVKIFNDMGKASLSSIHLGFQWLLDPDYDPDTNDTPDIVNNSWGFRENVNECFSEFEQDIQVLKAAKIAVVFSGGNEGPNYYTSISPANYPESLAVGAIDDSLSIASFSSRGPSICDGSIFPEVVAPGVNIKSSDITFGGTFPDSYSYFSGTSFAAPHVTGAMALLMNAFIDVTVSELENALRRSAMDLGPDGPDNDCGNGLIDVIAAYNELLNPVGCTDTDGDGYFAESGCKTSQDCNDDDITIYPYAPEIKHDGIDQDCNGYDLTIDVLKAIYKAERNILSVEAISELRENANLELIGYGSMKWSRKKQSWSTSIKRIREDPGEITVSGPEGSETAPTLVK